MSDLFPNEPANDGLIFDADGNVIGIETPAYEDPAFEPYPWDVPAEPEEEDDYLPDEYYDQLAEWKSDWTYGR